MNQLRVMTIFALVLGINGLVTAFLINSLSSHSEPTPSLPVFDHQAQPAMQAAISVETPGQLLGSLGISVIGPRFGESPQEFPATQSLEPSAVLTNTIYFPVVYNAPTGLYGYVTENGSPVSGIELELYFTTVRPWSTFLIMTTTTQATGLYQFQDVPTYLSCTDSPYCMAFYTTSYANTGQDPNRLSGWRSVPISSYTQGRGVHISSFDIVNPELIAPASSDIVTSTVQFRWTPRDIAGDDYAVGIRKEGTTLFYDTDYLGQVSEYSLDIENEICSQPIVYPPYPCSDWYGDPIRWYLLIRNETGEGSAFQEGTFIIQP